jgi:heparin binding hemagglutinin HbhA
MAVSLPTSTDVRKAREAAAERAEVARTPLLAVLGAGDYAVATVTKAVTDARARATAQAEEVQTRVAGVQTRVAELPQHLSTDALRKLVADLRADAEERYSDFADRGERTWSKIRKQPQVKQAITTIETYTDKLDARVDVLVDDAHDVAEKALATVTRQTRSTGEKAARATQRFAAETAETVAEVATEASGKVAEAGKDAAATINEAGDEAASSTRSVTRRAANRTEPKAAAGKPATRRATNGTKS